MNGGHFVWTNHPTDQSKCYNTDFSTSKSPLESTDNGNNSHI